MSKGVDLWVPAERLIPILAKYRGLTEHLSARTQRKSHLIRTGGQEFASLSVVDEMLVEMDLVEWLMLPAEQGGLADIYFDGKQYGRPDRSRRKYESLSARQIADRERRRARDRLRDAIKVSVPCPRCGEERLVGARYAETRMSRAASCKRCSNKDRGELGLAA